MLSKRYFKVTNLILEANIDTYSPSLLINEKMMSTFIHFANVMYSTAYQLQ